MEIGTNAVEKQISLHDSLPFISKQDVAAGAADNAAYTLTGPRNRVVGIFEGTNFAPEFRDADGNKLDKNTRVEVVKCNKQGDRLSGGVVFNDTLDGFEFDKMRNDPDYMRRIQRDLTVGERQIVKIFVTIPAGANGFDAANSKVQVGDETSDFGTPVELIDLDDLQGEEKAAVQAMSQVSGGQ